MSGTMLVCVCGFLAVLGMTIGFAIGYVVGHEEGVEDGIRSNTPRN